MQSNLLKSNSILSAYIKSNPSQKHQLSQIHIITDAFHHWIRELNEFELTQNCHIFQK